MRSISVPPPVLWALAAIVGAIVLFLAGVGIYALSSGDDTNEPSAIATTTASATSTATPSSTATIAATATSAPVAAATTRPAQPAPAPTATPDFTAQPAVEVLAVDPALGFHIETASVDIAIDVKYQAGRDSNILGWEILYCASSNDCNTYGFQSSREIVPGAQGTVTLGAPFPAGGNYLRPIVLCQYTVTIGHFVTPEVRWQSQLADDERCHRDVSSPRIKVLDVNPDLGSPINEGDVIRVNVEYDAGPATQARVHYSVEGCAGDPFAVGAIDITPGTSSVATIEVLVSAKAAGTLRNVEAELINGDSPIATYGFGPC